MTKREFYYQLDQVDASKPIRLVLEPTSKAFYGCKRVSIWCKCTKADGTGRFRTSDGKTGLSNRWGDAFCVATYQGGSVLDMDKNEACNVRADTGMNKYQAWLDEYLAS